MGARPDVPLQSIVTPVHVAEVISEFQNSYIRIGNWFSCLPAFRLHIVRTLEVFTLKYFFPETLV